MDFEMKTASTISIPYKINTTCVCVAEGGPTFKSPNVGVRSAWIIATKDLDLQYF